MFVTFGQASGMIEGFSLGDLAAGGSLSACRPSLFHYIAAREELEARAASLFGMIASGAIRAEVHGRFALSEAGASHSALVERRTTGASVLLP